MISDRDPAAQARQATVCLACGGALLQPAPDGVRQLRDGTWLVLVRCPDCMVCRHERLDDQACHLLSDLLEDGAQALLAAYRAVRDARAAGDDGALRAAFGLAA